MYIHDTIAAICTPLGEGGIGIVRISGDQARKIGLSIFSRKPDGGFQSHRFYYGSIIDPGSGATLDEALVVFMQGPRSYTCEDILEIQCHGGYLLVQRILGLVLSHGARLAEPGEFTRRAFLNGRIDLIQSEAVIDIIRCKTDASLSLAQHQHAGLLSRQIDAVRVGIVNALAHVEAHIDFPEEEIEADGFADIAGTVVKARKSIDEILAGFAEGRALREGVSVLLAGKPNVGKSSLLNSILREKRAIVTAIPGTTRDVIEEVVNIHGLPVRIMDTAGICESDDDIESEGVQLALDKISRADLVLYMLDVSRSLDSNDRRIEDELEGRNFIVVLNKCDLPEVISLHGTLLAHEAVRISTLNGEGVDRLLQAIHTRFLHARAVDSREYVALSNVRHRDSLEKCAAALQRFTANAMGGLYPELLAIELREALHALGEITGETTTDDILDQIFKQFCIGK